MNYIIFQMDRDSDFTKIKKGVVRQKLEVGEDIIQNVIPCVEFENEYSFENDEKSYKLNGKEKSSTLCRFCCGTNRNLKINWKKGNDTKFTTSKYFSFLRCCNCSPFCLGKASTIIREVSVGSVQEEYCACVRPSYTLYDNTNTPYARIVGPRCCFGGLFESLGPTTFRLEEMNGRLIENVVDKSAISNKNAMTNLLGDADDYDISFPDNYTLEQRLNLLSALILIDYAFFEDDKTSLSNGCYLATCYCWGCVIPITCDGNSSSVGTSSRVKDKYMF